MRILGSLLIAWCLMSSAYGQDGPKIPRTVKNPAKAFWNVWNPEGRVLQFKLDFDLDGREDVAFADQMFCGNHGGCSLSVFLRRADGRYLEVQQMGANIGGGFLLRKARHGGSVATHWDYGSGGYGSIVTYSISHRGLRKLHEEGIHTRDETGAGIRRLDKVFGKSAPKLESSMTVLSHAEFLKLAGQPAEPPRENTPAPPVAEPPPHQ